MNTDHGYNIEIGITAATGSSQATGTAITKKFNVVNTVATAGDAVTLPTAAAGLEVYLRNDGANSADVFPASGDQINDASADAAYALPAEDSVHLVAVSDSEWVVFGDAGN